VVGPPGEKPIMKIPPQMLDNMKGIKGDHGKMGDPGIIGPEGGYNHIYLFYARTQWVAYFIYRV